MVDSYRLEHYRATLSPGAQEQLTAALSIMATMPSHMQMPTVDPYTRDYLDMAWCAHAVRHAFHMLESDRWILTLADLVHRGEASTTLYAAAEDNAMYLQWQETLPVEAYAGIAIRPAGVLTVAKRYGLPPQGVAPWFWCEECRCSCGQPTQRPLGGWCLSCAARYASYR